MEELNIYLQHYRSLKSEAKGQAEEAYQMLQLIEPSFDALIARVHLIRSAQSSICIQTFAWADDQSGRLLFQELLEAAKRGVKVRAITDGWTSVEHSSFLSEMAHAHENIETRTFNVPADTLEPSPLQLAFDIAQRPEKINQRSHNKLFCVDGIVGLIGGRNIQNAYFATKDALLFRDRDLLIVGEVVKDMEHAFDTFWQHSFSEPTEQLSDSEIEERRKDDEDLDDSGFVESVERGLAGLITEIDARLSDAMLVESISYFSDIPDTDPKAVNHTAEVIGDCVSQAKFEVLFQSPYFVLDDFMKENIRAARSENEELQIKVSTNSLGASDTPLAYAFSFRERLDYLRELRLQLFEFKPCPADTERLLGSTIHCDTDTKICCHSKVIVVDQEIVWLGSANLDPRSARLNTENGVLIKSKKFAKLLVESLESDFCSRNSWTIGLRPKSTTFEPLWGLVKEIGWDKLISEEAFESVTAFSLIEGKEVVPFYHRDFHQNYEDVGCFPEVDDELLELKTRLAPLYPEALKRWV